MKTLLKILLTIGLLNFISSCTDSGEIITTLTVIKGNVSDIERGMNIQNFKVVFIRSWSGSTNWDLYGISHEVIDSTRTDKNGNYEISFDFKPGERYGFLYITEYFGRPYFVDFIDNDSSILEGEENMQNIDAWLPVTVKLNLHVRNNNNPKLGISSYIWPRGYHSFRGASIQEQEIDTTVYLTAKPNTDMQLLFHYSTGYTNAEAFRKYEYITTTLKDTLELSYDIDCATFEPLANY